MLNIPGEVHFWTCKDDICIPETDFGAFRYHEKKEGVESLYLQSKKSYANGRGITWAVSSKKSSALKKDALRDLEDLLSQHRVVHCEWRLHDLLQVLLSSGLLISITINIGTGDILKISTDKYLLGKLPSDCLTDVAFSRTHIVLAFSDAVLAVVHLGRPISPPEKMSRQEPRLLTCDLVGPSGRRLERKLALSGDESMVLVWWRCAQDEVYPWSPVVRDCDRANLLVYSITGSKLTLLCFYKTEGDPLSVSFSSQHANTILLVEQRVSRKGDVSVESSTFEIAPNGRLLRSPTIGALQLQTQACCLSRSPDEAKLALGCIDGSILLQSPSSTLLVKTAFIPSLITWHPDGALLFVANEKGQLQCFDLALAPVRVQLLSEEPACTGSLLDITTYFRYQPTLCLLSFNKKPMIEQISSIYAPVDGLLLMQFERGPLAVIRLVAGGGLPGSIAGLTPDTLVSQYLRLDLADCAINVLGALSWDAQGAMCLACVHKICNHLITRPLSTVTEDQLEAALGTFMSPSVPLSLKAERQFGRTMHNLARRFFHQLLRYRRFEKAFRLAIDLGDRDLFMDLYYSARGVGNETLAQASRQKAEEIDEADRQSTVSGSSSGTCECSRSSCSECGSPSPTPSSSSSSDMERVTNVKPTKVTFSDTVTHIMDASSGDEEDGEEEDDEVQALIVSDAPLRHPPHRPPHLPTPQPHMPNPRQCAQSGPQPEFLITNAMSFNTISATTSKVPISVSFSSSSSYLAHLPGNFKPDDFLSMPPTNMEYYGIMSERNSSHNYASLQGAHTNTIPSQKEISSLSHPGDGITRNSELRSSISSLVPPHRVHQASITSLNPNRTATGMDSVNRPIESTSINSNNSESVPATHQNHRLPQIDSTYDLREPPVSSYSRKVVHNLENSPSKQMLENFPTASNQVNKNPNKNNFPRPISYTLTNETIASDTNISTNCTPTSRTDSSINTSSIVHNLPMATNNTPTSRNGNSTYTVASSSNLSNSARSVPLLSVQGTREFRFKPKTLKPLSESNNSSSLPLLTLGNSPLYLNPFLRQNTHQRENDKLNPPLFKISTIDLESSQHKVEDKRPSLDGRSGSDSHNMIYKAHSTSNLSPSCEPLSSASRSKNAESSSSILPLSLREKTVLQKLRPDAATEDEEALTNIKVVHFGVV